ncbi:MAG TPA: DUF1287 domain-containing protein, partial [Pyrinomonadaceae bacterium]|nr:DUF1287 domain-containing protein [Pyrinomonadaceae bacterium]
MNISLIIKFSLCGAVLALTLSGCSVPSSASRTLPQLPAPTEQQQQTAAPRPSSGSPFLDKFVEAAVERTTHKVRYDPAYVVLQYPGGDVPAETGVCTDEVIRSYRAVGVDLQKEVHEDMVRDFAAYPRAWGLKKPDSNIDHRRVPNLMTFFERKGASLPVTSDAKDYRPGDVVSWDLGGKLTHIGIVV